MLIFYFIPIKIKCSWIVMLNRKVILGAFVDTKKTITEISSRRLVFSDEKTKLLDVLRLMFSEGVRKIPVVDNSESLKGMVTTIDLLELLGGGEKHEIFKRNRENIELKVEKFMTTHVRTIHYMTSIGRALEIFKMERSGLYPIVDSKKIISVVSELDLVKLINRPVGIKVSEIMVERPIFIRKDNNIHDVAKMMCRGGFRRLPVVEDNILLGVVTPIDILKHLYKNKSLNALVTDKTKIEKIMNKDLVTIQFNADLFSAINLMKNIHIGGLPVTDEEELIGIVTKRDIVDALV